MESIFSAITNNTLKQFGLLGVMNWKSKFWLSIQKLLASTFGLFKEIKMQDGLQIFWISKRKFCVHVHTLRHLPNNYQCVSVTEERKLNGMAWDGTKSWFRNVSKDMKNQAIKQYQLLTLCDI